MVSVKSISSRYYAIGRICLCAAIPEGGCIARFILPFTVTTPLPIGPGCIEEPEMVHSKPTAPSLESLVVAVKGVFQKESLLGSTRRGQEPTDSFDRIDG